jgi:hypothetical protein
MHYKFLCVDKWKSQWHYRNFGVVVGDRPFTNIRTAAGDLSISIYSLHKNIVTLSPTNGGYTMYVVYNDDTDTESLTAYKNGCDNKVRVLTNTTRKRSREKDIEDRVRKTRMYQHRY